jgi:hypothetical protein
MNKKTNSHPARRFLAKIYRIWMMRHIDVPDKIARSLAKEWEAVQSKQSGRAKAKQLRRTKYIPVHATLNGNTARMTLLPAGSGRYRIQLNTALRRAARADAGDTVKIELTCVRN